MRVSSGEWGGGRGEGGGEGGNSLLFLPLKSLAESHKTLLEQFFSSML